MASSADTFWHGSTTISFERELPLFLLLFLIGALFPQITGALSPTLLQTYEPRSREETQLTFKALLKPTHENDLVIETMLADRLEPGTHLRIWYSSESIVPLELGTFPTHSSDLLTAVLPPASEGEALLPLFSSPSWNGTRNMVIMNVYSLTKQPPHILRLQLENHTSFLQRTMAYLRHPLSSEQFSYYSMSELAGYRTGGVPLVPILGSLPPLLGLMLMLRYRRHPFLCICVPTLCFLLFYETRFLLDILHRAGIHQVEWRTEGKYSFMGSTYAIAQELKEEMAADQRNVQVLVCVPPISALQYLLYPTPLARLQELKEVPKYAIVENTWDREAKTVSCADQYFSGTILRQFPDGEAIVRLHNF